MLKNLKTLMERISGGNQTKINKTQKIEISKMYIYTTASV